MFGSLGITELILILAIVLIVFGAGKLPKIGEGLGKALKGFKKEVREAEPVPQTPEQAQEAAGMQPPPADPGFSKPMVKVPDLQNLGSGIGDALRTFREAANDVKRAIDPSMHTIKAEVEAAQKEIQGSIDYVKEGPKVEEPPK